MLQVVDDNVLGGIHSQHSAEIKIAEKKLKDSERKKKEEISKSVERKKHKKKRMRLHYDEFDKIKAKLFLQEAQKEENAREIILKEKVKQDDTFAGFYYI